MAFPYAIGRINSIEPMTMWSQDANDNDPGRKVPARTMNKWH